MIKPRLLITDDDRSLRETLAETVSRWGLDVATAADGRQAIALLDQDAVHMVIVDFQMPGASGLDVIRHVRSRDAELPCILISAALPQTARLEAARLKACGILDKPLRLPCLQQAVAQSLLDAYGWTAVGRSASLGGAPRRPL